MRKVWSIHFAGFLVKLGIYELCFERQVFLDAGFITIMKNNVETKVDPLTNYEIDTYKVC